MKLLCCCLLYFTALFSTLWNLSEIALIQTLISYGSLLGSERVSDKCQDGLSHTHSRYEVSRDSKSLKHDNKDLLSHRVRESVCKTLQRRFLILSIQVWPRNFPLLVIPSETSSLCERLNLAEDEGLGCFAKEFLT